MKEFKLLLSLLVAPLFLFAQPPAGYGGGGQWGAPKVGVITGKILDGLTNEPVEYATIALHSKKDSSLVTGTITKADGSFLLKDLAAGMFYLEISFIGYETSIIDPMVINPKDPVNKLGELKLSSGASELNEVVVTESKGGFQTNLDKKVFNMSENLTSQGGSVLEALGEVPSVEVDVDNNVSLRGNQNVKILIDGRPSGMSASAVLQSLPASNIESIEVITNPSAKYDPEGTAGIINIVTKRSDKFGMNGNVDLSAGYGQTPKFNSSVSMNIRNNKMNVFGTYSYNLRNFAYDGFSNRETFTTDTSFAFKQRDEGEYGGMSHFAKIGMDYFLNKNNILYWSVGHNQGNGDGGSDNFFEYFDELGTLNLITERNNGNNSPNRNTEFNAGLQKKFLNPKQTLDIDLNYSLGKKETTTDYIERFYDKDNNPTGANPLQQLTRSTDFNDVGRLAIDYVQPLGNDGQLETGYNGTLRKVDNDFFASVFDFGVNDYVNDNNLINRFFYNEQIHALYGTYGQSIKKFNYKLGLRLEQSFTNSELVTTNETFENNYFSFFPSAALSYKLTEGSEIQLNYSRRINRPRTGQLNPFYDLSDPNNIRSGNPYLLPEYINSTELGYIKYWEKFTLNSSVYYKYLTDVMRRFLNVGDDGVSRLNFVNFKDGHTYGAEFILSARPYKWWRFNGTFNMYGTKVSTDGFENSELQSDAFGWNARIMSTWTVWKDMSLQLSGFYRAPFEVAQGRIGSFFSLNFAAKKQIFNKKGSIGIRVTDFLNTMNFNYSSNELQSFNQVTERNWESFVGYITFSYNFGKYDRTKPQRKQKRKDWNRDQGMPDMQ